MLVLGVCAFGVAGSGVCIGELPILDADLLRPSHWYGDRTYFVHILICVYVWIAG